MMVYKSVSERYIKSELRPELYDVLYPALYNLSSILSDKDGKICRGSSVQLRKDLVLTTPGIMMFGKPIIDYMKVPERPIPSEEYVPQVTYRSYNLMNRIAIDAPDVVHQSSDTSELLNFKKHDINHVEARLAACAIYLDSYVLYKELVVSTSQNGITGITREELNRVLQNIRCLSTKIETFESPPYDFLRVLRDLSRTLSYVSSLNWLFDNTHIQNVRNYRDRVNTSWRF